MTESVRLCSEVRSLDFTNAMPIRTIRVSSVIFPARSRAVSIDLVFI